MASKLHKVFDDRYLMAGVAKEMHRRSRTGSLNYITEPDRYAKAYGDYCTGMHLPTGTILKLTRDYGHHASGWWKNPDFEKCLHLSLSFRDIETGAYAPQNHELAKEWTGYFFGNNRSLLWIEPPYSEVGKQADVWHYRLFVHTDWKTPLLPRKEVYSKEFTDAGWKSWSDAQSELEVAKQQAMESNQT